MLRCPVYNYTIESYVRKERGSVMSISFDIESGVPEDNLASPLREERAGKCDEYLV